ncbi:MAG: hypothetical protein WBA74_02985 [Cyclobacteriaceae bacterium]
MRHIITALILIAFLNATHAQKKPSPEITEKLQTFNKLYGYVKYFHPSDEAAELDWNAYTIYGIEQILKSEGKDYKTVLEDLFLSVAPSLSPYSMGDKPQLYQFDQHAYGQNLDTIRWQHIGNDNFNKSVVYQSLRAGRVRDYYPTGYAKTKYLIIF